MAKTFKVAQKHQYTVDGIVVTQFTVDGNNPTKLEQGILDELKDELGWPMFIYEGHVEDHWGNVVQN